MGGPSVGQVVQQGGCWVCSTGGVALPAPSDGSTLARVGSASVPLAHGTEGLGQHKPQRRGRQCLCAAFPLHARVFIVAAADCVEAPVLPSVGWIGIDECLLFT